MKVHTARSWETLAWPWLWLWLWLFAPCPCSANDCEILQSSQLKLGEHHLSEIEINYEYAKGLIGLSAYHLGMIRDEKVKNFQKYGPSIGEIVCKHSHSELILNNLKYEDVYSITLGASEAFVTDLDFYLANDKVSCQLSQPSSMIFDESKCLVIINKVYDIIGKAKLTDLSEFKNQLKPGRNPVYLTRKQLQVSKPDGMVCYHSEDRLVKVTNDLRQTLGTVITLHELTDTALGTKFVHQLTGPLMNCGRRDFDHFMQKIPNPDKVKTCFNLNEAHTRHKRFSILEIGGQEGTSDEQIKQINHNFEKLTDNQKNLLKRFISLGIDEKIQTKLLNNHEENMKLLASRISGMELQASVGQIHTEAYDHLVNTVEEVVMFLQHYIRAMRRMQSEVSELLEQKKHNCKELRCQDSADVHIVIHKAGIKIVSYGRDLKATGGYTPACQMKKDKVNRFHLKHLSKHNDSHYITIKDEEIVSKLCLENYDQCKEEDIRNIQPHDLIDGKIFLIPSGKQGFLVQCKPETILITESGFLKCTIKPTGVQLPLTTSEGTRIGMEVLKVAPIRGGPRRELKDMAMELFRSSSLEFQEIMTLDKSWNKLTETETVNTHHVSFMAGAFGTITAVLFLGCVIKACLNCCTIGKPCSGVMGSLWLCDLQNCKKGEQASEGTELEELPSGQESKIEMLDSAPDGAGPEKKVIVDLAPWLKPPQ